MTAPNRPYRREVERQFWLLIRAGRLRQEAAVELGFHEDSGKAWFRQSGGVAPSHVLAQPSGRYLTPAEREEMSICFARGLSIRATAREIGRYPSTVQRELRRAGIKYRARSESPSSGAQPCSYRAGVAQRRAEVAARRPKPARLATNQRLQEVVQAKLLEKLSPKQISRELKSEYPDDAQMQVSHETIYQSIYVQGRGALRRELALCLRTGRAMRLPRYTGRERRHQIPGMIDISERPAEVEDRAVPGHWEGDLILGKNGKSAIGTLVERATRYLILLHLPNKHSGEEVEKAMVAATKQLPDTLWKSLTWDQGSEMRNHANISVSTGLDIYFCDPGKPWQRGSNENTNGLLRQYFPRGTDLSVHSSEHLELVANQMNRRPRQTLGWLKPREALAKLISESSSQPAVASIT